MSFRVTPKACEYANFYPLFNKYRHRYNESAIFVHLICMNHFLSNQMSTKCSSHSDEDLVWFCHPCEKLICEKCREEHSSHFVEETNSLLQGLSSRLPSIIEQGVAIIPDFRHRLELIDTQTDRVEQELSKVKWQLESRYSIIQAKLKAHHENLCRELEKFIEKVRDRGHHEKNIIFDKINILENIRDQCFSEGTNDVLKAVQTENACKRLAEDVRGYAKPANEHSFKIPEVRFNVPEDKIEKEVNALYGSLRFDSGPNLNKGASNLSEKKPSGANVKVVTRPAFPAIPVRKGQKVSGIIQTSSNDVIVGYSTAKVIHYYDRNGKKQNTKELSFYVQHMTSTSSGSILASENKGSRILKIDGDRTEVFFDVSPFTTHGILCSNQDGTVYVCCQSDKVGCVYVITSEEKLRTIIAQSNDGHALFLKPHRIAENPSSKALFVTDPGMKTLTAIDKHHICLFNYHGGPESSNFIPIDVAFCHFNNTILVSNWKGNSVHHVGEDGHFRSLVVCQKDNILYPTVMLVDCLKQLWVSHKEKITVLKCSFK